jgi:tellurite resistance protein TerC
LIYLSLGLSFILVFIGIKLILTFLHEEFTSIPKIDTLVSLGVIGTILLIATIASLIKVKLDPTARATAGRITGDETPHAHPEKIVGDDER